MRSRVVDRTHHKQRYLLFVLFIMLVVTPAFSDTLDNLIGAEQAAALRSAKEPITEVQHKSPVPRLLPKHSELGRFAANIQKGLEPNMMVEALYLYPKASSGEWSKAEQTSLLNRLVGLSTLAGIEYYSESRKAMRVFYETSMVIDDPSAKKPLPDPVYKDLPSSLSLYARQKDLTFGDNIYRYNFHTSKDAIFFVQENLTAMNAGIIPAIGKNKLHSVMAVIDTGDHLLLYTAAMAKAAGLPGMADRVGASFTNRAKAILKWFEDRVGK